MCAPNHATAGRSGNRRADDSSIAKTLSDGYGANDVGTSAGYVSSQGRSPVMRGIIGGMATATQTPETTVQNRGSGGMFKLGMKLVRTYVKLHPKPFWVSVAGALLFAVASLELTIAIANATNNVLKPAF